MNTQRGFARVAPTIVVFALVQLCGCRTVQNMFKTDATRFLAPEKVFRQPKTGSPINPIYTSIGPADTSQELVPNATFPREGDWEYTDVDYVIGPTDIVDISILDLFAEGLETILRREVSVSGFIDLPLIPDKIRAEDLTKSELTEAVINAYRPDILVDPTVSVMVVGRRQNVYSILGSVARPGQYPINRKDMRLLEALANAGGRAEKNIRYIYVIRPKPAIRRATAEPTPPEPAEPAAEQLPELPPEAPPARTQPTTDKAETVPTQPGPIDIEEALRELGAIAPHLAPESEPATQANASTAPGKDDLDAAGPTATTDRADTSKGYKWVYADGRWIRHEQEAPIAAELPGAPTRPSGPGVPRAVEGERTREDPFGWRQLDKSDMARVIAINLSKLDAGDPRMNIIIRKNDIIRIPIHEEGEFYVVGEVQRPGVYRLTARQVTVKQAMAAAGNMGPLAWPENVILYRRIGNNQEQIYPLDLEAIFKGEEPDFFLKPYDVVAVGTSVKAPFFAVVRNAFRMTYGFGFIYDRNFADPLFVGRTSRRFTRW